MLLSAPALAVSLRPRRVRSTRPQPVRGRFDNARVMTVAVVSRKVADRSAYGTAVSIEVMPCDACSNEMKHAGAGRTLPATSSHLRR
jgi:hypothetical protein